MMTTTYAVEMRDDAGSTETVDFDHDPSTSEIHAAIRDWVEGGEWGEDGARVDVSWTQYGPDGDEMYEGDYTVDIEVDHASLIAAAARTAEICGTDPDDHDWTSEGEGGCTENPGVWSTGGTSMTFASHCRKCGLHRTEHHTGSQRNPGEHDTVEYRMLDDEEIELHRKHGTMDAADDE